MKQYGIYYNSIIDQPKFIALLLIILCFVFAVSIGDRSYGIHLFIVAAMASLTANIVLLVFIKNHVIYPKRNLKVYDLDI